MPDAEPARDLVERWRTGDEQAAAELYSRYSLRLYKLAERQIGQRLSRRVGPDDIVQSVFRTLFRRTANGEYPIDTSVSLWKLLVRITLNKIRGHGERHGAGKRDLGAEIYLDGDEMFLEILARDPTPEQAAVLVEELDILLKELQDSEPEIVRMTFEGYSSTEIAREVGCSRWTVRRVQTRVGNRLRSRMEQNFGE